MMTGILPDELPESRERPNTRSPAITTVVEALQLRVDSRKNTVTNRTEVKKKNENKYMPINDHLINTLWVELGKNNIPTTADAIKRVFESEFSPPYNPFTDYLDGLKEWDGSIDYIQQLADTVKTTDQAYWRKCFKKWIVTLVASLVEDKIINHHALILQGDQGAGKSTWLSKLVPTKLKTYYYSGTIDPRNKDTAVFIAQCMIINLDELENLTRRDAGSIKEIITKGAIKVRSPYAHFSEDMVRRASFAGSVNQDSFLTDPTGSRRFLCHEVESINYDYKVHIDNAYAQARSMYMSGYRYHFDRTEEAEIMSRNAQFTVPSIEDGFLARHFAVTDEMDATDILTSTELLVKLHELSDQKLGVTNSTLQRLGKTLARFGYTRVKRDGLYKYLLKRISGPISFENAREHTQ